MARTASFPVLDLHHRPELFDALLEHPFGDDPVVEASFGDRPDWIIVEPERARALLRRRDLEKGRTAGSRAAVGGYPSRDGADFRRRRSEVIVALASASADTAGMRVRLAEATGGMLPSLTTRAAILTRWMLLDLTGASGAELSLEVLVAGIAAAEQVAESAQAGRGPASEIRNARATLERTLTACVAGHASPFLDQLRVRAWRDAEIADELIALALAGWESTAAALTSGLTIGLGPLPREAEIEELLRLYPPSWLIVRTMTGDEDWGSVGDLAVVSPWLTQRSAAWADADRFDPGRADRYPETPASMPFGVGPRRCPADLYARTQLMVTLETFGGSSARPGHPALVGHRSAALLPDFADDEDSRL